MPKFFHGMVIGVVATVTLTGTAYAATGGNFILGRANGAGATTTLKNNGTGPTLSLPAARTGQPPIAVSAGAGKAINLNADKLDGLDSGQLQRRIGGTCPEGEAIRAIGANGGVACNAADGFFYLNASGTEGLVTVECPQGTTATSGGASTASGEATFLAASIGFEDPATGREGWLVAAKTSSGALGGTVHAEVHCFTGPVGDGADQFALRLGDGISATEKRRNAAIVDQYLTAAGLR